jgi:hypothetical protein
MIQYIITLLLSLGLILNSADYNTKNDTEKKELHKKAGIVEDDVEI